MKRAYEGVLVECRLSQQKSCRTDNEGQYYYEHILRDEKEMDAIRRYISKNPFQRDLDNENPRMSEADP